MQLVKSHGDEISDQNIVENILQCLLGKFYVVVVAIKGSKDLTQLSVDELMGSLLSNKFKMNRSNNFSLENVIKSQVSNFHPIEIEEDQTPKEATKIIITEMERALTIKVEE